jgi:hypothetical protein
MCARRTVTPQTLATRLALPLQIAEEGFGASIDPATHVLRFAAEGAGAARSAAEAEAEVARLEAELQVR